MRPFLLLLLLAAALVLAAQKDGADPAAIAHIRAEYLQLEDPATNLKILDLDDGTEVAKREGKIRRIVTTNSAGTSSSYYYSPVGNPIFLFEEAKDQETRIYYDPLLEDGPGRLRMIRWVDGEKYRLPSEADFTEKAAGTMKAAYDLLHRAEGELKYTAEIYGAICQRLERIDALLAERELVATDTINQLEAEEPPPPGSGEPYNPCWDDLVKYTAPDDTVTLRTVRAHGCDEGGMAYTALEVITDFDEKGKTLRSENIVNEFYIEDPDGQGPVNRGVFAKTTTYFNDGKPVYELLTSEHQGFEVFRRLTLLEE